MPILLRSGRDCCDLGDEICDRLQNLRGARPGVRRAPRLRASLRKPSATYRPTSSKRRRLVSRGAPRSPCSPTGRSNSACRRTDRRGSSSARRNADRAPGAGRRWPGVCARQHLRPSSEQARVRPPRLMKIGLGGLSFICLGQLRRKRVSCLWLKLGALQKRAFAVLLRLAAACAKPDRVRFRPLASVAGTDRRIQSQQFSDAFVVTHPWLRRTVRQRTSPLTLRRLRKSEPVAARAAKPPPHAALHLRQGAGAAFTSSPSINEARSPRASSGQNDLPGRRGGASDLSHGHRQIRAAQIPAHLLCARRAHRVSRRHRDPRHADRHFPADQHPGRYGHLEYTGLSTPEMEQRVTTYSQYSISSNVNGIKDMESQTLNGISVQKIYFQPDVNLDLAIAQIVSATNAIRALMPPGIQPPIIVQYNASSVPVLQLSLTSDTPQRAAALRLRHLSPAPAAGAGPRRHLSDAGRRQVPADHGRSRSGQAARRGLTPIDVVNAVNAQNLTLPSGDGQDRRHAIHRAHQRHAARPSTTLNDIPIKYANGATIFIKDVGHVRDGSAVQQNIVRENGRALGAAERHQERQRLDARRGQRRQGGAARSPAPRRRPA